MNIRSHLILTLSAASLLVSASAYARESALHSDVTTIGQTTGTQEAATPEPKAALREKAKERYENASPEEKEQMKERMKQRYKDATPEQRTRIRERHRERMENAR